MNERFYHFSLDDVPIGTMLEGRKKFHKKKQRFGQRIIDEEFDEYRKKNHPSLPSLFTSLWLTDRCDQAIIKKKFVENPDVEQGYLYEVTTSGCKPTPVAARAEIEACQLMTFEKPAGMSGNKRGKVEELAEAFWTNDPEYRGRVQDYLSPCGGIVTGKTIVDRKCLMTSSCCPSG